MFLCLRPAWAEDVLQAPDAFIAEAFAGKAPKPKTFWVEDELKETVADILDRKSPLRFKYWRKGNRTVWILNQIGKYKPITTGFIIKGEKIEQIKVLIYRESHGWEVKYPFFTDQFVGVALEDMESHELDKSIDGISGATLSVRSLIRLSRLALTLHHEVTGG